MFVYKNENPKGKKTSDCVVRAIVTATGKPYEEVARELLEVSLESGFAPHDKRCYQKYLRSLGFVQKKQMKKDNGKWYSISEMAGIIVDGIVHSTKHLTCIKGGNIYDTWNCSSRKAGAYYIKGKEIPTRSYFQQIGKTKNG